jgi:hypothetical protein
MGKFINTDWKVVVASKDLSDHAYDVQIGDEKEQVDVSGFSPTGARSTLPGQRDQTITVSFLGDYGSSSVFQTIQPLYEGGSVFAIYVQPDSDAGTSGTNPLYGGSASVYSLPVAGQLNQRNEMVVEFKAAPGSTFSWGTTAP